MAKMVFSGSVGYGLGLAESSKKVGWFARLLGKKQPETTTEKQPSEEGNFEGGLGGLGATYNISLDLSLEELKGLYELNHSDEEWTAGRMAAEFKSLGNGIYAALREFAHRGAEPWNAAVDTACKVYRHAKDEDLKTVFQDRDREVADLENRLAFQRKKEELLDEDAHIRAKAKEKKEKAEK